MHCAYAFLLIPEYSVLQEGRLLVIGVDTNYSHYSVHKPLIPDKFPEIRPELDIAMTTYYENGPGTYVRAYCSIKVSVRNIMETIISGHDDITDVSHINFGVTEKDLAPCLSHIQLSDSGYDSETAISLKGLLQKKVCSTRDVFSLNFRNELQLTGHYGYFARKACNGKKWINLDVPIETQQIFLPNHVFGEKRCEYENEVKVLSIATMGHLHIFKRNDQNSQWWPETFIGLEKKNAFKLADFICRHYVVLKPVMKTIYEYQRNDCDSEFCCINCYKGNKEYRQEKNRIIAEIRSLKLGRIPEIDGGITN
ncbi:BgTH12-02987 [Blumeria graminis f. sp. triticale]|uniref:BgTH12-02987 n=1 Tax=Blumeria graminis f. sp. triticale TaxID=1689686 RepID=A0A9W4D287_BLUGR|nr:BgTH12-02987 [Blumeria graminis f. sp. triticale]